MRLFAIFLFVFWSLGAAAAEPPAFPVFNSKVWYDGSPDAALPAALNAGHVRYFVIRDAGTPDVAFELDFEAALLTWLRSLRLPQITVGRASSAAEADVVIHFSTKDFIDL